MPTHPADMTTHPVDLTLELRSADGTSAQFHQTDEERIRKTLYLLASERLLTPPRLTLASEQGVSTIPCWAIDMILAHTSAPAPQIFPLIFPADLLDITEVSKDRPDDGSTATGDRDNGESPRTLRVEIQTLGGWVSSLKALAITRRAARDQRHWLARILDLPLIPFRLEAGGIGLINSNNITRVRACSTPDALPETALPMELRQWTPACRSRCKRTLAKRFDHENEHEETNRPRAAR